MKNMPVLKQITSLQGLRATAFVMVLLGHCSVKGVENLSGVAVSLFFILSGFVSYYAYDNKDLSIRLKDCMYFAGHRMKNLYTLHLILLIAMIVLETFEKDGFKHDVRAIICNMLLIQAWFPDKMILNSFNGITWYLSASMLLYFIFPVIKFLIKKYRNVSQTIMGIICILLFYLVWLWLGFYILDESVFGWFQYFFPLTRCAEFLIGCHVGYIYKNYQSIEFSYKWSSVLEVLALVFLVISWQMMRHVVSWGIPWIKYIIILPASTFLVYILARSRGCVSELLSNKHLVKLGNISGYTYIIHYVVLRYIYIILYRFDIDNIPPLLTAIATFVLTLLCVHIYFIMGSLVKGKLKKVTKN